VQKNTSLIYLKLIMRKTAAPAHKPLKPWGNPGVKSDYFGGSSLRYEPTNELVPKKLQKRTSKKMKELKQSVLQGRIDDTASRARNFKWSTPWRPGNINASYLGKDHPGGEPTIEGAPKPYVQTLKGNLKERKNIEERRMRKDLDEATQKRLRTIRVRGWVPNGYAANNYDFDEARKRETVGTGNIHGKY